MNGRLAALIRGHRPEGDTERAHQLRMLDWLRVADAPFNRECFNPGHATGSGFVVSDDGRVALIHHAKLRLWVQPGGHAEAGETEAAAVAARETGEELGIAVPAAEMTLFDLDVHRIARAGETPAHTHFDMRFLCVIPAIDLPAGSDAEHARWFTRTELAGLGLDAGLRRMVDKGVAAGVVAG